MASTSSQSRDLTYLPSRVKVTILATEWGSSHGGDLSSFIRELAVQLAKCPDVEITLLVPKCNDNNKEEALSCDVCILKATPHCGFEELDWLLFPPKHLQIDVIVGLGMRLGRYANGLRTSHGCKWVQIVYSDPEEEAMFKSSLNSVSIGEENRRVEVDLSARADFVVGVGPKISEVFRNCLRCFGKDEAVVELTPGIFHEFLDTKVSKGGKLFRILVFGHDDFELKGIDIAARAVATLPDTRLVFVGGELDDKCEEIVQSLLEYGIQRSQLKVRSCVGGRENLKREFCGVDLALMPSRADGFGLGGLEALSAGLPVLVSKNSGFGEALNKLPNGSSFVIDSEKPEVWAAAIQKIWNKDRQTRLDEAELLRSSYEEKYSWTKQIDALLPKMISLVCARLRLRLDYENIAGPATDGEDDGVVTVRTTQESLNSAKAPVSPNEQQTVVGNVGNVNVPSKEDVLNFIAMKYFQVVDPSNSEQLNGYLQYLTKVRNLLFVNSQPGSLIVTVECSSLQILDDLWKDYSTGHLNEMAQKFLVTKGLLEAFGLIQVKLKTTISEDEYRSCRGYFLKRPGRLQLHIKCFQDAGEVGGAAGMIAQTQRSVESESMVQRASQLPSTRKRKALEGSLLSSQAVLNAIQSKYFQASDPSKPEESNGYVVYLTGERKVVIVDTQTGSLIITVECNSLQILEELWEDYRTYHLDKMAQEFLVTEDLLEEFGLASLKLSVTIAECEYRACWEHFLKGQGVQRDGYPSDITIFVETSLGRVIKLAVESSDPVENLKTKIKDKVGIPSDQSLVFAEREVKDGYSLDEYNIRHGSILHLVPTVLIRPSEVIIVRILMKASRRMITLATKGTNCIEHVKRQIELEEGVPPKQQSLIFAGKVLEDRRTLSSYNIQMGSTLEVVHSTSSRYTVSSPQSLKTPIKHSLKQREFPGEGHIASVKEVLMGSTLRPMMTQKDPCGSMDIFILTPDGRRMPLAVEPSDSVQRVKAKVEQKEGTPASKQRVFMELEDGNSLSDYGVHQRSTVYVQLIPPLKHVFIELLAGKTISLSVNGSDSIEKVKARIQDKTGFPSSQQRLFHAAMELKEGQTLDNYRIQDESTLRLVLHRIFVKMMTNKRIRLAVKLSDSVEKLKAKIEDKEGILTQEQRLRFGEKDLKDSHTLSDYNIEEGSPLLLDRIRSGGMRIFVKNETGNKITLDVGPNSSIKKIKTMIHDKEGIPLFQQILWYFFQELQDHRTLDDYCIQNESTLYLLPRQLDSGMHILSVMPTEQRFPLSVEPSDSINDLKIKVYKVEGIPPDQQRFIFSGKELSGDHLLKNYNIRAESVLHLVRRRQPGVQIFVDVQTTIAIEYDPGDAIGDVKAKIQEKEGIRPHHQRLVYGVTELVEEERTRTLRDCKIQNESSLQLIQLMKIFVRDLNGKTNMLHVAPTDLVETVKKRVYYPTIYEECSLVYAGKVLENDKNLSDYHISKESTLHVILRYNKTPQ